MTAVIQCPKCQQKYRLPRNQIGTEVQCAKQACGNRFVAVDTIAAVTPASPAPALPPDVSGSTALSRDTEMRLEAQRLTAVLDQDSKAEPDLWSGHILFWSGAAMLLVAVMMETTVIGSDGHWVHNLPKAGEQLQLLICGLGAFVGGTAFLARDVKGLWFVERAIMCLWIFAIAYKFAHRLLL